MRPQLNDHQKYFIEEFVEEYQHGHMDRREMMRRVLLITGSVAATASVLTALGCAPQATTGGGAPTVATPGAPAAGAVATPPPPAPTPVVGPDATVGPNDPAIEAVTAQFPGPAGQVQGYLARPRAAGTYPGLIVIHENMGLVDHIQEVTRRIAKLGYVALAVDLLSRAGGTANAGDAAAIAATLSRAAPDDLTQDLNAGVAFLKTQQGVRPDRLGVFGFCFGGTYSWRLVTTNPEIAAAVPFYGTGPDLARIPGMRGAVFAVYAEQDPRINNGPPSIQDIDAAMRAANKRWSYKIYPNTGHGFHRTIDRPGHLEAARQAWQDMVAFFQRE
ncbi:MAG: dienelactone hydrolase family protein, partial [Dehalococcoidia bacterium]|nr:dienelactone hydrolase family protein [Dehalococcoidia bacterium]